VVIGVVKNNAYYEAAPMKRHEHSGNDDRLSESASTHPMIHTNPLYMSGRLGAFNRKYKSPAVKNRKLA